jgi:hypothetical protein
MNKMRHSSHGLRIALLAGASVVALAAAAPSAGAADLNKPTLTKAPPSIAPLAKDTWTWWIEGGAFNTAGGDANPGAPGFGLKPKWGPEGRSDSIGSPLPRCTSSVSSVMGQRQSADHSPFRVQPPAAGALQRQPVRRISVKITGWFDFGIGRDFGLGNTHAMWTLGVRVADLRSKLTANGSFAATTHTATPSGGSPTVNIKGTFSSLQKALLSVPVRDSACRAIFRLAASRALTGLPAPRFCSVSGPSSRRQT